ncbi:MAG TPA: sn-glycerol-3-phosphate ABC transporter substrate-binding protein UgpB [Bdellovibrionota bacterium]|jgi:sn-glycerol 3-phosphate transport system substrate-binding protein
MKFLPLLALLLAAQAQAKTEISFWHAMSGDLEKSLNELVAQYNKSQDKVEVKPVFKGNYTETLNAAIAAYRGNKHPHLVQVFEVGTQTMMSSDAIIPVQDLVTQSGVKINWGDFVAPVLSYYKSKEGKLMSMPFNSSSPILYFNKDWMKKAGIKAPPKTWQDLYKYADQAVKAGAPCGLVVGWQPWVLVENFSAIHNIPFASLDNGYGGAAAELKFNTPEVVKNLETLQSMTKNKSFVYEGRRSDPSQISFSAGHCAFYMDSSGNISTLKAANKFPWGAAPLPYNQGTKPKNSIIGGATLWVFKGHSAEENKGVADFIRFLGQVPAQEQWHKATGYLPITKTAYKKLKQDGYYKQNPEQEVAIVQLTRSEPVANSRGIRLGGFTQVREIMDEEMEKIWAGKSNAQEAMNTAVERGNRVLRQFAKSIQ